MVFSGNLHQTNRWEIRGHELARPLRAREIDDDHLICRLADHSGKTFPEVIQPPLARRDDRERSPQLSHPDSTSYPCLGSSPAAAQCETGRRRQRAINIPAELPTYARARVFDLVTPTPRSAFSRALRASAR